MVLAAQCTGCRGGGKSLTLAQMRSCFSKGPGAKVRPQPWQEIIPLASADALSCRSYDTLALGVLVPDAEELRLATGCPAAKVLR